MPYSLLIMSWGTYINKQPANIGTHFEDSNCRDPRFITNWCFFNLADSHTRTCSCWCFFSTTLMICRNCQQLVVPIILIIINQYHPLQHRLSINRGTYSQSKFIANINNTLSRRYTTNHDQPVCTSTTNSNTNNVSVQSLYRRRFDPINLCWDVHLTIFWLVGGNGPTISRQRPNASL